VVIKLKRRRRMQVKKNNGERRNPYRLYLSRNKRKRKREE
jgi:hypothetical protein